jgi:hypothetical protein
MPRGEPSKATVEVQQVESFPYCSCGHFLVEKRRQIERERLSNVVEVEA